MADQKTLEKLMKTAIENKQNLIVEGCYVPFDWAKDFSEEYLINIKYYCLVMSESYIKKHFDDIKKYACVIEKRLDDSDCTIKNLLRENANILKLVREYNVNHIVIDDKYDFDI